MCSQTHTLYTYTERFAAYALLPLSRRRLSLLPLHFVCACALPCVVMWYAVHRCMRICCCFSYCSSFISKVFIINSLNTFCCYCRCNNVCKPRHLIVNEYGRKTKISIYIDQFTSEKIICYCLMFMLQHFVAWIECVRWMMVCVCMSAKQRARVREKNKIQSNSLYYSLYCKEAMRTVWLWSVTHMNFFVSLSLALLYSLRVYVH